MRRLTLSFLTLAFLLPLAGCHHMAGICDCDFTSPICYWQQGSCPCAASVVTVAPVRVAEPLKEMPKAADKPQ